MFEKSNVLSLIWMERSILGMNYSHSPKIFKESRGNWKRILFLTNNSSKSQRAILRNLEAWDTDQERSDDDLDHVIIKYLKEHYDGKSIYVLGPHP
ncbi:MAG: hypothetical protein ACLRM4_06945 [Anaerostipes sp.]|uniref:hypothetical protein n=1 Tax=Anaerostipes sp. TaxID=1872530 RepID=UPI0039A23AE2